MNALEFLSLAGKLVAAPTPSEAACSTAVSRSYYACFHLAKEYLVELGFRLNRDHAVPQRLLMSAGVSAALRTGQNLSYLQSERVRADYELDSRRAVDQAIARHCVEVAHDLLTLLSECRLEQVRDAIKAGIEDYQRRMSNQP